MFSSSCLRFLSFVQTVLLEALPRRRTDGSFIIDEKAHVCKRALVEGGLKLIRRKPQPALGVAGGIERQYRELCKGCSLPIAYRSLATAAETQYWFILPKALTSEPQKTLREHFAKLTRERNEAASAMNVEPHTSAAHAEGNPYEIVLEETDLACVDEGSAQ